MQTTYSASPSYSRSPAIGHTSLPMATPSPMAGAIAHHQYPSHSHQQQLQPKFQQHVPAPSPHSIQSQVYTPVPHQIPHTPSPATTSTYLPALPPGVVTEEVVASLDRYPLYEQQAWQASLPPHALSVLRQMATNVEMRKRADRKSVV